MAVMIPPAGEEHPRAAANHSAAWAALPLYSIAYIITESLSLMINRLPASTG